MNGPSVSDDDMFLSRQIQLLSHSDNVQVVAAGGADDEIWGSITDIITELLER